MKRIYYIKFILFITILSSFVNTDQYFLEFNKLQKYELLALRRGVIGKTYVYDLTNNKACNKTSIKYLGTIKTKNGKQYKFISSFFVFSASSTCHGTSNIKIYNMKNQYIGLYYVGMPDKLPTKIIKNKYLYWSNSKECNPKGGLLVNFEKGLPKKFFLPCSDEYIFSSQ